MQTRREFLSVEELNTLAATPCERPELKNAALFSALTGLCHCDIQKMQWKEIQIDGDQARLNFTFARHTFATLQKNILPSLY